MSDNLAFKRLYSSSSSVSAGDSPATTTATTPDPSQSRRESEHDASDPSSSTDFNPTKVSSKLTSLAASARAASQATPIAPGSDEGHPNDPLLRVYDPIKDNNLSIDELLARPRLPRSPAERAAMRKLKAELESAAKELGPQDPPAAKSLLEQAGVAAVAPRKADREKHMRLIRDMARDLKFSYTERE